MFHCTYQNMHVTSPGFLLAKQPQPSPAASSSPYQASVVSSTCCNVAARRTFSSSPLIQAVLLFYEMIHMIYKLTINGSEAAGFSAV